MSWSSAASASINSSCGRSHPAARDRYQDRWSDTQRDFVDQPAAAVERADVLVREVMHDRGYPVEDDFEQRAADISVEHPQLVEDYRAAHGISVRARSGRASTEDLRTSMVHFRALFEDLLAPASNGSQASDRARTQTPAAQTTTRSR